MKIYIITGGFGSGKTAVAQILRKRGFPVLDTDQLAHQAMETGKPAHEEIFKVFGESVFASNRSINRKKIGELVFQNTSLRKKLEKILHPKVREAVAANLLQFRASGVPIAFIEVPLLFETGWDKELKNDGIITVFAEKEKQIERVLTHHQLTREEVIQRIAAQLPTDKKIKKSNFVIENNESLENLTLQVENLIQKL